MDNENNMSGPSILWGEIEGKKVKSVDGENLGKIEKISQNHVKIEEGLVTNQRFWIPKLVEDYYYGKSIWLDIKKDD